LDPQALLASRDNAIRNGVSAALATQDPSAPASPADFVFANILAATLIELQPTLASLIKPGGELVLSGILSTQETEVAEAYRPHLISSHARSAMIGAAFARAVVRPEPPREIYSLFTQCSKCETIFQLSADVLRAAGGQVRCGRCGEVFNALARLAEQPGAFTVGESPLELETRADQILQSPPQRPEPCAAADRVR
jgi:predicted Zn finger-like uncharacterized protein